MRDFYDVIVIGGGHAGTEAAWAAANAFGAYRHAPRGELPPGETSVPNHHSECGGTRRHAECGGTRRHAECGGTRVALITMDPSRIGTMSCNPAIGGLAKGQIVREIDALGGIMGRATDATGIQFRVLNMSKGPAVRGPRAQCDKYAYAAEIQRLIASHPGIDVIAGTVDELIVEDGRIVGVRLPEGSGVVRAEGTAAHLDGDVPRAIYGGTPRAADRCATSVRVRARAVVLTTGTFMRALMHTGEHKARGGRVGEGSAEGISGMLRALGFELGRLKTGTPPRLAAESIDWSDLEPQHGDAVPVPFSDLSPELLPQARFPLLEQIACHTTHTTREAHDLIRANLHRAPMYSGQIDAECGPRYCPSIEDKVVRFADRDSHHVFLEPESLHTNEVYCNGISTSLPQDVQEQIVRAMRGCANARILRFGYAVEYDMVWPHQIDATCMTKRVAGLFLAGQINGTSGYEEAGGQGLVAGMNAARYATGLDAVRLGRDQAYIGVMLDDLVTKTPREPYRMFTSRAEHRLLLRSDNADARLTPLGRELGLVDELRWERFEKRRAALEEITSLMRRARVNGERIADLAKRPRAGVDEIAAALGDVGGPCPPCDLIERVMIDLQYEGYIARQRAEINRQRDVERMRIPGGLNVHEIKGLRRETAEALAKFAPATMGQAGRLAGVNPADLTILAVAIRRFHEANEPRPRHEMH